MRQTKRWEQEEWFSEMPAPNAIIVPTLKVSSPSSPVLHVLNDDSCFNFGALKHIRKGHGVARTIARHVVESMQPGKLKSGQEAFLISG